MTKTNLTALLNPVTLPFTGKHLIEASAGTGKTFNITRLYLRALLEKALPVEQILVMTFSNAATEEIRGRVADTLLEAIDYWQQKLAGEKPAQTDPVYHALFEQYGNPLSLQRLQAALLVIDEASIYTIHGFCQHVLSTYAFDTGVNLHAELHTDNSEWLETATKDWLRSIRTQREELSCLAEFGWHTPEGFLAVFASAINKPIAITCRTEQSLLSETEQHQNDLQQHFSPIFEHNLAHVLANQTTLYEQLVIHKKADTQHIREGEWQALLNWLQLAEPVMPEKPVDAIMHGRRYSNNESVKALMEPLKALKNDLKKALDKSRETLARQQAQQPALEIAYQGIKHVQQAIAEYKQAFSILEFDDLVLNVAQAVSQSQTLAEQLESNYPIALVDEFQDTDAAQYQMLSHIYQRPDVSCLMMIGDPKQAIYGFRGGDIFTYLAAGKEAQYRWHMDTNWRSTEAMIAAYNGLFAAADFDFNIQYLSVNASSSAKVNQSLLKDPLADRHALQFVSCDNAIENVSKAELREVQAVWVANEISRLLQQGTIGSGAVESKDIAILVRSFTEAKVVSQALQQANITHVYLSNQQSVYSSAEAQQVLMVLNGIYHNADHKRMSAALTSPLLGFTQEDFQRLFVQQLDESWDAAGQFITTLRKLWLQSGVLALLQKLIDEHLLLDASVLQGSIERSVTNYQHLAELLQKQVDQQGMHKPDVLLSWLNEQLISTGSGAEDAIQRLEKDENAVQIVTQHKSKGLEYPIVFIPFASDYKDPSKQGRSASIVCQYYDEQNASLVQQLGDSLPVHKQMIREGEAEAMRLLYVAITRAMQRCYVLVAQFENSSRSAIGRCLAVSENHNWLECIERFKQQHKDCGLCLMHANTSVDDYQQNTSTIDYAENKATQLIAPKQMKANVSDWRLSSFSGLVSSSKQWHRARADENDATAEPSSVSQKSAQKSASDIRFTFPKGAAPGNVLHDMLEHKDFSDTHWADDNDIRIHSLDNQIDTAQVTAWLDDVLAMPITLSAQQHCILNTLPIEATLREAEFYFPVNKLKIAQLQTLIRKFRAQLTKQFDLPSDSAPELALNGSQLAGMMHGFIDLIVMHNGQYYVADYKSNFMGTQLSDYQPKILVQNIMQHNYDVQAIIYSVALHRYLAKTIENYNLETHFGGAVYLYLRGMSAQNQSNEGAAVLPITAQLVLQANALFADTQIKETLDL